MRALGIEVKQTSCACSLQVLKQMAKRTCEARETAQAMSGLVLVDSHNKAPIIRCPRLIHSKCSGFSWSGGSGSSFLKCSGSPVVHLVLEGTEELCSSNKASVYVAW